MKKVLSALILVCALITTHTVNAQVKVGVVAGMNLSKLSYDKVPDCSSGNRVGWYVGPKAQLSIPIVGIGLDIAAEYSQRKLNTNGENKTYRSVEIPLNLRYQFGISLAKVYVATGPQFGFQMGNKSWKTATEDFELKRSNTTWNVGAGVMLFNHLEVGAVYNIALSKYAKKLNGDGTFKVNTWQIQMAYYL